MVTVTIERRIPLGDVPSPCTDPTHDLCFSCCGHDKHRCRIVDAHPGATNPSKIIVQCENCGAHGEVTDAEMIDFYAQQ